MWLSVCFGIYDKHMQGSYDSIIVMVTDSLKANQVINAMLDLSEYQP